MIFNSQVSAHTLNVGLSVGDLEGGADGSGVGDLLGCFDGCVKYKEDEIDILISTYHRDLPIKFITHV